MRPEAGPWWRQAEADLVTGRDNLAMGHSYAASWFAEQAAEKALKALYIEQTGSLPPRIHDLGHLGTEVGAPASLETDLTVLSNVLTSVRYPDSTGGRAPVDEVTPPQASQHLESAERVLAWVRERLR